MNRLSAVFLSIVLCACSRDSDESRALPGDAASRVAEESRTAAASAPQVPADAPLVAFLGDSIAAGLHLSDDDAFPAVVQRELAELGTPFRLINAGVSGDTSAGGLRRVEWLLTRSPDVVVIELGGNDGLRGQDLAAIERNLRDIIAKLKAADVRALLLGMQVPTSLGGDYASGFEALYERVAESEDVPWVPKFLAGVGGVSSMNLEDGLHPTVDGHRKLAANMRDALRDLLRERP